jgi:large subunit ribosomal protein L30
MAKQDGRNMAKLKVTQINSRIGSTKRQKATLDALGLTRLNRVVEHNDTPQIMGMIRMVDHLVKVEKV